MTNNFKMQIPAISQNEAFARNTISAFVLSLSPTIEEINDIKTAISEAVTNCVVHAYDAEGIIAIEAEIKDNVLFVTISDNGKGITDVEKAREPMFTSGGDERSGMGFTIMETFMDSVEIISTVGQGTSVTMTKAIKSC